MAFSGESYFTIISSLPWDQDMCHFYQSANARGRITWRDMLCMTALKAGLPVAVPQLFSFIAVAASEIVAVVSSNSSFISFWRSFRGNFWEVLWTLKLTQSQVGIVGLKIVNSLNRINRCIKFRKRNRSNTRDFCCIFYRFVDFLTLNTLTQLYFKKPIHILDQYCFEKLPVWRLPYFGQRSRFFARF